MGGSGVQAPEVIGLREAALVAARALAIGALAVVEAGNWTGKKVVEAWREIRNDRRESDYEAKDGTKFSYEEVETWAAAKQKAYDEHEAERQRTSGEDLQKAARRAERFFVSKTDKQLIKELGEILGNNAALGRSSAINNRLRAAQNRDRVMRAVLPEYIAAYNQATGNPMYSPNDFDVFRRIAPPEVQVRLLKQPAEQPNDAPAQHNLSSPPSTPASPDDGGDGDEEEPDISFSDAEQAVSDSAKARENGALVVYLNTLIDNAREDLANKDDPRTPEERIGEERYKEMVTLAHKLYPFNLARAHSYIDNMLA